MNASSNEGNIVHCAQWIKQFDEVLSLLERKIKWFRIRFEVKQNIVLIALFPFYSSSLFIFMISLAILSASIGGTAFPIIRAIVV